MTGRVAEQVVIAPRGKRVDLDQAVLLVERDERGVRAGGRLVAAHAREPHLVAGQRGVQRGDLAHRAAGRRVAGPEVLAVRRVLLGDRELGQHVHHGDVHGGGDGVTRADRLREVVAGVEEEDVHEREGLRDHVGEDGVRHRAGDGGEVPTQLAGHPGHDRGGVRLVGGPDARAAELDGAARGDLAELRLAALDGAAGGAGLGVRGTGGLASEVGLAPRCQRVDDRRRAHRRDSSSARWAHWANVSSPSCSAS